MNVSEHSPPREFTLPVRFGLEVALAAGNLAFLAWSLAFFESLYAIEITLPITFWVGGPALVLGLVFVTHALTNSGALHLAHATDERGDHFTAWLGRRGRSPPQLVGSALHIRVRDHFPAASGVLLLFHFFVGLGLLYHGTLLISAGARGQGIILVLYALFVLLGGLVWGLRPPHEVLLEVEGDENQSLMVLLPSGVAPANLLAQLEEAVVVSGTAPPSRGPLTLRWDLLGAIYLVGVTVLFLGAYLTPIYTFQLVDVGLAGLLFLAVRRILNARGNQQNPLSDVIVPPGLQVAEALLWLFLCYETAWKAWTAVGLALVDPRAVTPGHWAAALGAVFLLANWLWRLARASAWKTHKWVTTVSLAWVTLVPITAVASVLRLLPEAISIAGIWFPI